MSELKENVYSWFTFKEEALLKDEAKPTDYRIKEAKSAAFNAAHTLPLDSGDDKIAEYCEADIKSDSVFFDYTSEEEKQKSLAAIKTENTYSGDDAKLYEDTLEEIFAAPDFSVYFKGKTLDDLDEENHRISLPNVRYLVVSEMSKKSGTDYLHDYNFSSSVEEEFNDFFAEEIKATKKVRVDTHDDIIPENNHVQGTWAHFIREWEIEEAKGITRSYPVSPASVVYPVKVVRTNPSPDMAGARTQVFFEGAEEGHYLVDHGSEARFNYDPKGLSLALTSLRKFHDEEKVSVVTLHDMSVDALRDWVMASAMLELDGITMRVKMAPEMRAQVYTDEFNAQLEQRKALIQAEIAKRTPSEKSEEEKKKEEAQKAKEAALAKARAEAEEARKEAAAFAESVAEGNTAKALDDALGNAFADFTEEELQELLAHKPEFASFYKEQKALRKNNDALIADISDKAEAFAQAKEAVLDDIENGTATISPETVNTAEKELADARKAWEDFALANWESIKDNAEIIAFWPDRTAADEAEDEKFRNDWKKSVDDFNNTTAEDSSDARKAYENESTLNALILDDLAEVRKEDLSSEDTDTGEALDLRINDLEKKLEKAVSAEELNEMRKALDGLEKKANDDIIAMKEQAEKAARNAKEKSAREEAVDTRNLAIIARRDADNGILSDFLEERGNFVENIFSNLSEQETKNLEATQEYQNFYTEMKNRVALYARHDILASVYADKTEALAKLREAALENPANETKLAKAQEEFAAARDEFFAFIEANRNNGNDTFAAADKMIIAKIQEIRGASSPKILGSVNPEKEISLNKEAIAARNNFAKDGEGVTTFGDGTPVIVFNTETGRFESNIPQPQNTQISEHALLLNYVPSKRETRDMAQKAINGDLEPFYISSAAAQNNLAEFIRFAEEMSEVQAPFSVQGSPDAIRELNEAISVYEAEKTAQAKAKTTEKTNSPVVGKDLNKKAVKETVNNMTGLQARINAFNSALNGSGIAVQQSGLSELQEIFKITENQSVGFLNPDLREFLSLITPIARTVTIEAEKAAIMAEAPLHTAPTKENENANSKKIYDLSSDADKLRAKENKRDWLSGVKSEIFADIIKNSSTPIEDVDKLNEYMKVYKKTLNEIIVTETRKLNKNALLQEVVKQIGTFEKFEPNSGVNETVARKNNQIENVGAGLLQDGRKITVWKGSLSKGHKKKEASDGKKNLREGRIALKIAVLEKRKRNS